MGLIVFVTPPTAHAGGYSLSRHPALLECTFGELR
jgi:hypothetical protein